MGVPARNAVKIVEPGASMNGVVWNCTGRLAAVGAGGFGEKRADMLTIRRLLEERRRRKLTSAWRR
jgi:hypothetical protein